MLDNLHIKKILITNDSLTLTIGLKQSLLGTALISTSFIHPNFLRASGDREDAAL